MVLVEDEAWAGELLDALKAHQGPVPLSSLAEQETPATLAGSLRRVGGVFVPIKGSPTTNHDLTDTSYAWGLYRAASAVTVDDRAAVTDLVSQWGFLGVGPESSFEPPSVPLVHAILLRGVDSFAAVRNELAAFQTSLHQLQQLKRLKRHSAEAAWREFSRSLDGRLEALHPTIRWHPEDGALPAWTVKTPRDVLWATLWDLATRGGQLRRCRHCQVFFATDDPRKVYCEDTCTNRASAARWYRRQKGAPD